MANPIPDTRRPSRTVVRSVRLSEAEAQRCDEYAARLGVAPSTLMRAAYVDAVDGARVPTTIAAAAVDDEQLEAATTEMRALKAAINKVGGNLNQMVRLWNANRGVTVVACDPCCDGAGAAQPDKVELKELVATINELRTLVASVEKVRTTMKGQW